MERSTFPRCDAHGRSGRRREKLACTRASARAISVAHARHALQGFSIPALGYVSPLPSFVPRRRRARVVHYCEQNRSGELQPTVKRCLTFPEENLPDGNLVCSCLIRRRIQSISLSLSLSCFMVNSTEPVSRADRLLIDTLAHGIYISAGHKVYPQKQTLFRE